MSRIINHGKIVLIVLIIFLGWCPAFGGSKTFDEIFKLEGTIQLQRHQNEPPGINALKIGRDGRIWIVTSGRPDKTEVRIYSSTGEVLKVIRKEDIGPIGGFAYILFTDIAFDHNYRAYILEAVSGNVAVIESTGGFLEYFISDKCAGAGANIKIDREENVYLGGPCYQEKENLCPKSRDFCIHKYDSKGRYIISFFPFEKRLFELTPTPYQAACFDLDMEGNVWCAHQMVYQVSKYSPDGKLLQKFPGKSSLYMPPTKLLSPKSQKAKQTWYSSWTPIHDLLVLEPNLILLAFSTHFPSGWVLEIYDQNGNILIPDVQTHNRPLWKDDEGFLYFFLPGDDEEKGGQEYIKIGKFSLNLSAISKIEKQ